MILADHDSDIGSVIVSAVIAFLIWAMTWVVMPRLNAFMRRVLEEDSERRLLGLKPKSIFTVLREEQNAKRKDRSE